MEQDYHNGGVKNNANNVDYPRKYETLICTPMSQIIEGKVYPLSRTKLEMDTHHFRQ